MFGRLLRLALKTIACLVLLVASLVAAFASIHWIRRPPPDSAEGLLSRADELAWNNNWGSALPLFARAQSLFEAKGDYGQALYAKVSQTPVLMESHNLGPLISDLNRDLRSPAAKDPDVRLRVLEMKARCEEEYNAELAVQTFAQVEDLALREYKPYLASRASGERGILAFTLGDFEGAATRVKRAYAVAKFLGDPAGRVRFASMIGLGLQQMGRPKQALVFLDEAIDVQRKNPAVAFPYVAINAKIDTLSELGRYREALALADSSIPRLRAGRYYGQLQSLLTSRSDALMRSGKTHYAISGYREALGYAHNLSAWRAITNIDGKLALAYEHSGDLQTALSSIDDAIDANKQAPGEMFLVPGNLALKARILAEMGRKAEAERLYATGADVIDVLLSHVPTPEVERLLIAQVGDLYSGYFRLLSDQGRLPEAFRIIERAHGRIEAQQLSFDNASSPHPSDAEELRLQQLEMKLIDSRDRSKREEALGQIPIPASDYFVGRNLGSPAPLARVQDQLGVNELLVEYVLAEPSSYALVIDRGHISRYVLPRKSQVESEAKQYRESIQKRAANSAIGKKLFSDILGFIRDYPPSASLVIVADGDLHLLPFSALIDETGRYVIENRTVSLAPSATVLSLLRGKKPFAAQDHQYLGVAPWADAADAKSWVLKTRGADEGSRNLPPLPQSRDEVESIAAMMQRPSTVLIGSQATKQRFEALPLRNYRILHFALHGILDPVFPDRSALAFAPSTNDDGRLQARDIRHLQLKADLVTLSACDTAVGPVSAAGVESLDTAFIEAGADSVVSALWELQDSYTDTLMKSFYSHLRNEGKAAALRDAKLDLLRSHIAPCYWAAFELVGNPDGSPFTESHQLARN